MTTLADVADRLREIIDGIEDGRFGPAQVDQLLYRASRDTRKVCRCDETCCPTHGTHVSPHRGCVMR